MLVKMVQVVALEPVLVMMVQVVVLEPVLAMMVQVVALKPVLDKMVQVVELEPRLAAMVQAVEQGPGALPVLPDGLATHLTEFRRILQFPAHFVPFHAKFRTSVQVVKTSNSANNSSTRTYIRIRCGNYGKCKE